MGVFVQRRSSKEQGRSPGAKRRWGQSWEPGRAQNGRREILTFRCFPAVWKTEWLGTVPPGVLKDCPSWFWAYGAVKLDCK